MNNHKDQLFKGIALTVAAIFSIDLMVAAGKLLSEGYHVIQIVFMRNLIGMVPVYIFYKLCGGAWIPLPKKPQTHLIRSTLGIVSLILTFSAVAQLPLPDVTVLLFSAPLFITVLSIPLLGERVGLYRWSAVIIGFLGVLIAARPSGDANWLGIGFALAAAFFLALIAITMRWMGRTEDPVVSVLYFFVISALVTGFMVPFVWEPMTWDAAPLFLGLALAAGAGQIMLTASYVYAPASALSPYRYTSIIWSILLGWLIWAYIPGWPVLAGAAIIIASNLFIVWREHKNQKTSNT